MGLVFVPLYIRYLGVEAYGLIGIFIVLQTWLALLDMGMTPTVNREVARHGAGVHSAESICDLLRTFELVCYAIAAAIAVAFAIASGWIARDWLNSQMLEVADVARALSLMGVVAALRFVEGLYRGAILGFQRHAWLNTVAATIATVRGGGAVMVLAWIGPTIQNFFIWQALVSMLTVLLFYFEVHRRLPKISRAPKPSLYAFTDVWKFAGGMFLTTVLALILTQVDKIILSRVLTLEDFGSYMFATAVAGVLFQIIGPIAQSYYPRLTALVVRGDDLALGVNYHQGAQLMTIMLVPAGLALVFFPDVLLIAWTNNTKLVEHAAPVVAVLAAGTVLNGFMHIPYMLQLAYGWPTLAVRLNIVAVIFLIPALFVAIPIYGPIGAALVWLTVNGGYVFFTAHFMHMRLLPGHKWRWYIQDMILPTVSAIGIYTVAALLKPVFSQAWVGLVWVVVTACIATVAAFISLPDFKKTYKEIFSKNLNEDRLNA